MQNAFVRLLCNTDSINNTYLSNHTLEQVTISSNGGQGEDVLGKQLKSLLKLNVGTNNQSHVAIKKILQYHNIDMKQLFGWDSEDDQSLKSLPYVIDWFERADEAVNEKANQLGFPTYQSLNTTLINGSCRQSTNLQGLCHCNLSLI